MEPIKELYPIWLSWRWDIDVPKSSRAGIPRGEPIPIAGTKFLVAASMILFPRGLDLSGIAELWEMKPNLVAKWRTEERFRKLVARLEEEFAVWVLNRISDARFVERLHGSPAEPECWSDYVLEIFVFNVARAIRMQSGEEEAFYLLKEWVGIGRDAWWLNLSLPEPKTALPVVDLLVPPKNSDAMLVWQDLLTIALQNFRTYPQKTGPKPMSKNALIRDRLEVIYRSLKALETGELRPEWAQGFAKDALSSLENLEQILGVKRSGE
jgi:hypothetical protein